MWAKAVSAAASVTTSIAAARARGSRRRLQAPTASVRGRRPRRPSGGPTAARAVAALGICGPELRVDRLGPEAGSILGRELLQLEVEDLRERRRGLWAHFVDGDRTAEFACDRCECRVLEPAGRDPIGERRRIEVDV